MAYHDFAEYLYLLTLLFSCVCAILQFRRLDSGAKILAILVCSAFVNESIALYLAKKYHNNLSLYSIYCFIEYGILCLYFNSIIDIFTRKNFGIYIGIAGIILGVVNAIFFQPINSFNSYFLFFEDLSVIGMSLFAFFRLLLKEDTLQLYRYPHFWFITILVFFWSITFLSWGLYYYINIQLLQAAWKINFALTIVGAITYGSFGGVFLYYPKFIRHQ